MKITVKTKKGTDVCKVMCDKESFFIGKSEECLVSLSGWRIGKRHAQITRNSEGIHVQTLDSKQLVYINNNKVDGAYGPMTTADVIRISDYCISIDDGAIRNPLDVVDSSNVEPIKPGDSQKKNVPVNTKAIVEPSLDRNNLQLEATRVSTPQEELTQETIDLGRSWKLRIHGQLIKTMDLRRTNVATLSDEELRKLSADIIDEIITDERDFPSEVLARNDIAKQVLSEAVGLGPLEDLLADPDISEVMVNSCDEIYFEKSGNLSKSQVFFSDDRAVLSAIERIVSPLGRRIDEASPMVDARLKDGSRVNAIIPPLALKGPSITIRKFMQEKLTMDHLVGFDSVSQPMVDFLKVAVEQHLNIIISGGTGSGKTTLLNALSNFIPETERIVTVEDAAELKLNKPHVVSLEARPENQEGAGAVTIRDLVKNCLRMRPDRIVVGECRSGEALDMLQAMNTGHDGSLTTVHSNSPRDCVSRLEVLVLMSGMELPVSAIREQIASAVHLIVQQSRFACGARKITSISEITGVEGTTVQISEIFRYREQGYDSEGRTHGCFEATGNVPEFYSRLSARGVAVDLGIFSSGSTIS